ncbi:MAG: adenosylcobinamide-GDP ribazoletransferase, partial [Paracoccaceae bacterium]|nr:adenosylcobinamide-GDP ribazoletransferase [Paracoccaceae bacterium]
MPQNDSTLARPGDILAGFVLLTRLPVRASDAALTRGAAAAWAWPVVGAVLGGIAGTAALLAMALGLSAP